VFPPGKERCPLPIGSIRPCASRAPSSRSTSTRINATSSTKRSVKRVIQPFGFISMWHTWITISSVGPVALETGSGPGRSSHSYQSSLV
jgi:hypothetical protein